MLLNIHEKVIQSICTLLIVVVCSNARCFRLHSLQSLSEISRIGHNCSVLVVRFGRPRCWSKCLVNVFVVSNQIVAMKSHDYQVVTPMTAYGRQSHTARLSATAIHSHILVQSNSRSFLPYFVQDRQQYLIIVHVRRWEVAILQGLSETSTMFRYSIASHSWFVVFQTCSHDCVVGDQVC